jgi:hypothetical protein
MNQYIITEEQLETMTQRRGAIYISCQGKFRDEIVKEVRAHPYNPQADNSPNCFGTYECGNFKSNPQSEREKVLDEVIHKVELMIDAEREQGWDGAYTTEGRIKLNVLAYVSNSMKELREGKDGE